MKLSKNNGFTLIEIMIAITLFTIIMIIGTGAVLRTNANHKKAQTMRTVIDNLSFIMEDMARNLRLGGNYYCLVNAGDETTVLAAIAGSQPFGQNDCATGTGIAFTGVDGKAIIYELFNNQQNKIAIRKLKEDDQIFKQISPDEVEINLNRSGFTVVGGAPGPADLVQPRVTIRLSGNVVYQDIVSSFNLQTTVSQRLLDN